MEVNASFAASFLMILVAFFISLIRHIGSWLDGQPIMSVTSLVILANILFYYAQAAAEEGDDDMKKLLAARGAKEWRLRVLSQSLLLGLPLSIDFGAFWFCVTLIVFYVVILRWDAVVFSNYKTNPDEYANTENPYIRDISGLILSLFISVGVFFHYAKSANPNPAFLDGVIQTAKGFMDYSYLGFIFVGVLGFAVLAGERIHSVTLKKIVNMLRAPRK
jgi:hypothetical protein